jgi:hypothetical protein
MDRVILEGQLTALEAQLATTPAGTPASMTIEAQITTLQNELAMEPVVPPIFGPHPWHGIGRR